MRSGQGLESRVAGAREQVPGMVFLVHHPLGLRRSKGKGKGRNRFDRRLQR